VRVELLTDLQAIKSLEEPWEDLVEARGLARSSAALVNAWGRHYRTQSRSLHVWVAWHDDLPVGMLALSARTTRDGALEYVAAGEGAIFGLLPVTAPELELEVAEAVAGALAGADQRAERLELHWLPRHSRWTQAFASALVERGWALEAKTTYLSPWIDLASGGFEGWLHRRSPHFASNLARRGRRLAEMGFERRSTSDPAEIAANVPRLRELYVSRQSERGGGGGYRFDAPMSALIIDAVADARPGRFSLATLARPGEVIAASLSVAAGGRRSGWLAGFDQAWSSFGPGYQAVAAAVEHGALCGDRLLDLGTGGEAYKEEILDGASVLETWRWAAPGVAGDR
jgi:CelD/BcsL family acetyltransferase involved in cellulose biosynthesis